MLEDLENEKIIESKAKVTLVPEKSDFLSQLLATQPPADGPETALRIPRGKG
jgi:hypothetical protein